MNEKSEKSSLDIIQDKYYDSKFLPEEADSYDLEVKFRRESVYQYVRKMLQGLRIFRAYSSSLLASWYKAMDSGQPWFFFWIMNTCDLLTAGKFELRAEDKTNIISYLRACQHPDGGFAGAPHMEAHVASTYSAICTLVSLNCEEAYTIVDRKKMLQYLLHLKHNKDTPIHPSVECAKARTTDPGAFEIHVNGENDMRSTYCSLVTADMLNLLDHPKLVEGVGDYIATCQTYEGGIACVPFGEAHAGYTFCGLASLILINETHKIDITRLLEWSVSRQLQDEGGFNGRINKFVDSCYNFWQGAIAELADIALHGKANYRGEWLYNQRAVQAYTLMCCQSDKGGMIDKPLKSADLYHTCYSLSGLSVTQGKSLYEKLYVKQEFGDKNEEKNSAMLAGDMENKVSRTHPLYNLQHEKVAAAKKYFAGLSDARHLLP